MNGSENYRDICGGPGCFVRQGLSGEGSTLDRPRSKLRHRWKGHLFCDDCWDVIRGANRITELEAENTKQKKRLSWFEGLIRAGLMARVFRRFFVRRSYAFRMEQGLMTILSHAGSAIECCDEPGAGYLRDICEIVDRISGVDTREEET